MTEKQRFANVLTGKSVDRFPVQIGMSHSARKKYQEHYHLPDAELCEIQNPGNGYVVCGCTDLMPNSNKPGDQDADWYDELGVGWKKDKTKDIGAINTVAPIRNVEDIKNYRFPNAATRYSFADLTETIRKNKSKTYFIANQASGTFFNKYRFLRGFEEGLVDMMIHQKEALYLLDQLLEWQLELARRYIQAGVDGVTTGDDVALQKGLVINPDIWRKLIKPRQKKLNQIYKDAGLTVIHHCCGDCRSIIKDYIETGVDCLNPVQPEAMPIEKLIEEFGANICFYGGVGVQSVMQHGTPAEVDKATEKTIRTLGKHGRYIVAPSHTMQDCIPCENVRAFFEAIDKYNR
ncbi:MAG: uroporphyrinogen decarboxylase family protein [Verrucomicrobiae bacterium]|nr:uroporphyrinogen decarboxylase family protein [Verrucomicrobiae bacterium]